MKDEEITLAVLAGGAGSRMGKAKGELLIHGRPVLEFLLKRLDWPGPTMLVTAPGRERPAGAQLFDREVIDPAPGMGPVRGILTALENLATPLLAVVTVDMPAIGRTQVDWLGGQLRESALQGAMCAHEELDGAWQVEPFPMVISAAANDAVKRCLEAHGSAKSLSNQPGFRVLPAPATWGAEVWTNLNTPMDLETFLRKNV